ncbi:MAG: tetratricopeptide repeat protein [Gammaproteobacteria bacterium]|nr:tetratricopeptide repeat protein [Gammaproteobacteria bacterium]
MKIKGIYLVLFLVVSLPGYATKDPQIMQEDRQQIDDWKQFFNQLVKTHDWYKNNYPIKEVSRDGGYANNSDYYQETSYYHRQNQRLLSRIRWIKNKPGQIHMIEVFVYDEKGRVNRDYLAAWLPGYRNAPIQTLVNLHHYNDKLHAYRQFDASGELIYEQCKGKYFNEKIMLSIEEEEFALYRDETADSYETYIACFEMLPKDIGPYQNPFQAEQKQQGWNKQTPAMAMNDYDAIDSVINKLTDQILHQPDAAHLYIKRGDAWFQLHEFDKAVRDYDQALNIDRNADQAWFGRGMAYGRMGQIDKGIADLGEFIKRNPKSSLAYTKRGVRHLWKGDREKAAQDLQKAIALNPDNAEAHDDMGVIYAQQGKLKKAVHHFSRTITIDPTYQKGHHNLAMAYHLAGNHNQALSMIDRALAIKENEKVSLLLKSQILEALGMHKQAALVQDKAEYLPDGNWSELAPGH